MGIPLADVATIDPCRFQKPHHADPENIDRIAADLEAHGHLMTNPVHLIRKDGGRFECVAGHDRLAAAKKVGLDRVPYRDFTGVLVSDEEIFAHWKKDNGLRKTIDRRADAAETLLRFPEWSDRRVADTCGLHHTTVGIVRRELIDAKRLVDSTTRVGQDGRTTKPNPRTGSRKDKAPASWKPEPAAKAEELVADLPEDERAATLSLVDEPGIPDVLGVEMVGNVAAMEPEQRKHVLDLHRSEDPRDKSKAKSLAADKPPMPDPRCLTLERAALEAKRAIQWCDRDPDPSFRQRIEAVVAELHALSDAIHEATRSDAA